MLRLPGFISEKSEEHIKVFVTTDINSLNRYLPSTTAIRNCKKKKVSWEYQARQWKLYKRQWSRSLGAVLSRQTAQKRIIDVEIVSMRSRLIDLENLYGGSKPIRDALQELGWLYDDAPKWGDLVVRQEKAKKGETGTWITLRKRNESE